MSTEQQKTKTETPDPFASFDPMTSWTRSQQAFHELMAGSYARAQAFADQYAALEAQMLARAHGAVESWAKLAQDALAYSAQLSAEARKLGFEAARKTSTGA